jgi:hypothetical protein
MGGDPVTIDDLFRNAAVAMSADPATRSRTLLTEAIQRWIADPRERERITALAEELDEGQDEGQDDSETQRGEPGARRKRAEQAPAPAIREVPESEHRARKSTGARAAVPRSHDLRTHVRITETAVLPRTDVPDDLDTRVHDRVALDEIALYSEVLTAVAVSERRLTLDELDNALGLRTSSSR